MSYFVIHTSEDGDVYLSRISKANLLKDMTPDDSGYAAMSADKVLSDSDLGDFNDLQAQGGTYIIIKGEIVTPTPKKVVTAFELE